MSNVVIVGSNPSLVIGTIGTNGTLSEEIDLGMYTLAGLIIDGASNGTLQFWTAAQALANGGTYRPIYNADGTVYSVTLPSGNVAFSATAIENVIAPYRYVRLVTTVAQSGAPACKFVVKG